MELRHEERSGVISYNNHEAIDRTNHFQEATKSTRECTLFSTYDIHFSKQVINERSLLRQCFGCESTQEYSDRRSQARGVIVEKRALLTKNLIKSRAGSVLRTQEVKSATQVEKK